jgi:c-di-GMP-binding flagellar brake protein YcgR
MKLAWDQYALDARYTPEPHVHEFAMRSDTCMESDSSKRAKAGVRERRYSIRHPFAADAEILELESGTRVSGVTSDLSLGGCFVCARRTLEVGARVRGTLTHEGQQVKILAVVRVVKPQVGMGLEFLDIDPDSNATLLAWIENLRKSR